MKHNNKGHHWSGVAVAIALALGVQGCNDNSSTAQTEVVKDNAYYRALAEGMVQKMTPDERLGLLVGPGYVFASGAFVTNLDALNNLKGDVPGSVGYINGVYNAESGLDIAASKLADGAAGVRIAPTREGESGTFHGTAFPVGTLLASTWDADLVKQVGAAIGNEVKEYGLDVWLAPGMNIQRDPLNGRSFEYFSEDPLVSGVMGAAEVAGAQAQGVGTTIKHFIANNAETSRSIVDNIISPRAIREIYLRGFQYAEEHANPWAVMTAMNKVNGTYTGQWTDLNTQVLRNEWGFEGFVMSDWWSGDGHYADMINSGNDLIEPGGPALPYGYGDALTGLQEAYAAGSLSADAIAQGAVRILTQVLKMPSNQGYVPTNAPDLASHASLSRQAASDGMVLLKNHQASLPLAGGSKVASFGITQINTLKGGAGSGDVNAAHTVNVADGLAQQFAVDGGLDAFYRSFFEQNKSASDFGGISTVVSCPEPALSQTEIAAYAASNDVAVITLGRNSMQGVDRQNVKGDYQLSDVEQSLIDNVSSAFHGLGKKVVVVLNTGGVMDTSAWQDKVDAILLAYMPGQEAGHAVADLLSGVVNPSGKLTQTFPVSYLDVPSSAGFPGTDTDGDGTLDTHYYNEGIYVGYRYYATFGKGVNYPFGHGLSYTQFDYKNTAIQSNTLSAAGGKVTLTTTVYNSGSVSGREVAQVYVAAPAGTLGKPAIELKAFAKTKLLPAGASETLSFEIPASWLASFDNANNEWIIEPGTYKVYVAPSSEVAAIAPQTFTVSSKLVVSKTTPGALALPAGVTEASFETQY
ncbi:glycoside hydrolase family 3 C-terminal domain-containing protein [Aeromonas sp. MR16]|uniref:beta-glucosidase family protein n=1 Tax=Aeromonas sp. MR16 TaxID=2923420 RepID=UPI001F4B90A1|nr:glycoside hydrolase family 3 C-terminal domain-containing protein [Aeromonas sp. MR16]MCH7372415.1 glycoside hydrolase family 3 C-terminal domain-containing protein [Aeromonas sp. MR16]